MSLMMPDFFLLYSWKKNNQSTIYTEIRNIGLPCCRSGCVWIVCVWLFWSCCSRVAVRFALDLLAVETGFEFWLGFLLGCAVAGRNQTRMVRGLSVVMLDLFDWFGLCGSIWIYWCCCYVIPVLVCGFCCFGLMLQVFLLWSSAVFSSSSLCAAGSYL